MDDELMRAPHPPEFTPAFKSPRRTSAWLSRGRIHVRDEGAVGRTGGRQRGGREVAAGGLREAVMMPRSDRTTMSPEVMRNAAPLAPAD